MGNFFSSTGTASQNSKASELPDLPAQAIPIIDEAYNIQTEVESTIDRLAAAMETSRSDEHQPTISVETLNKKLPSKICLFCHGYQFKQLKNNSQLPIIDKKCIFSKIISKFFN